jgi:hypothetical protein
MKTIFILAAFCLPSLAMSEAIEARNIKSTSLANFEILDQESPTEDTAILTLGFTHKSMNSCETFVGFEQESPRQKVAQYRALKTVAGLREACQEIVAEERGVAKIELTFSRGEARANIGYMTCTFNKTNGNVVLTSVRETCGICGG